MFNDLKIIYSPANEPLISLGSFEHGIDESLLTAAEDELLTRRIERKSEGFTWGYLLGVEHGKENSFPKASRVIESLLGRIKGFDSDFNFSFCKVCRGQSAADSEGVHYEGMHLDTHPGLDENNELLRVLINLSVYPRKFRFALADRHKLTEEGVELDRTGYKILSLPCGVQTSVVEIPGRLDNTAFYLRFWASAVPLAGITEPHGYFLASFEALKDFKK